MATMRAQRRGDSAMRQRHRSVRGLKTCICPEMKLRRRLEGAILRQKASYKDRYPSPANEKLLCPLGKLRHPSCRMC